MRSPHIAGWRGRPSVSSNAGQQALLEMTTHSRLSDAGRVMHSGDSLFIGANDRVSQADGVMLAFTGTPSILDWSPGPGEEDIAERLTGLYRAHGTGFTSRLGGNFTIALYDREQDLLLVAVDAIGIDTLFYSEQDGGLVFGSSASAVIAHPEVSAEISPQSIYDYVYYHHCPSPTSIYSAVKKLQGGEQLLYRQGRLETKRYWQPVFNEDQSRFSIEEGTAELKAHLFEAVARGAVGADATGAFLSGGLDSSSVAGALAKVYPGAAQTYSIGFPVEGYDELEYARTAVQAFGTRPHEYYLTAEDTVAAIPRIAAFYDEPFGNSSALPAYYCAALARESGVIRLLAGDGGDEIFAGNERYVQQLLFDRYRRVPKALRTGLEALLDAVPGPVGRLKLAHKAKRYVAISNTPMPDRLQDYNFLHRHAPETIFEPGMLETIEIGEPLELLRSRYGEPDGASMLNRMLYMDWKSTLHDNDLVKVNRMCEMAGVEVVYPLLDRKMVDLSCRIPSSVKLNKGKLRWFYKYAMKGFLPDTILNKSKHGFGLPFGIWMSDHEPLRELAYDSVGSLKQRGYFQASFLDHAVAMHQSVHASYYGELIWILMMLELWLASR